MAKEKRRASAKGEEPAAALSGSAGHSKEECLTGRDQEHFPMVGIGASAGGLDSLVALFSAMPDTTGIAFVLVTHLSPDHHSIMAEILQKKTRMEVLQVTDNMTVRPDHVYVIPPNRQMLMVNGTLQLLDMEGSKNRYLPIDFFFRSLAKDQGKNGICVILSGAGTDGTLGLKAVKGEGGMVMVQDEETAKYKGMPHSAIATGLADFILPPEKMAEKLLDYVRHARKTMDKVSDEDGEVASQLQKIFVLLKTRTGHDFSLYKKNTICRRIERRMSVNHIDSLEEYVRYLQESSQEANFLFKDFLIGVTSFFRDPEAFEVLRKTCLPGLLREKADGAPLRIWVPACSSGEEVYSIAIVVKECMDALNRRFNVQIFGTDIDEEAIGVSRAGSYPESIGADVGPERLEKFFIREECRYQIAKSVREMVVFAVQNIVKDPPFTKLDLLCCRNLLIYFGPELQKKLMPIFHYSLQANGILFLGSSESIGQSGDLFTQLDKKWNIFRRMPADRAKHNPVLDLPYLGSHIRASQAELPEPHKAARHVDTLNLLKSILQNSGMPACVVIDDRAEIVYIHGRTGRYLEPAEGETNNNIFEMARPGLKAALTGAVRKAAAERQERSVKRLRVRTNGDTVTVDLTVRPLPDKGNRGLLMILFQEFRTAPDRDDRGAKHMVEEQKSDEMRRLEDELQYTRENLQTTIEELQTSNEELKSANEELQSTNEELQSTNEELETSREELQSLNEEAATVNAELQSRIDELVKANDDIKNLLDATEIATIFLDIDLRVRRFTPMATRIFPLTVADEGRPISHFASNLLDDNLHVSAEQVLKDLTMLEAEVRDKEGGIYRMRVRPYRTASNVIDGVVITFEDVTKVKNIEMKLKQVSDDFEEKLLIMSGVFGNAPDPILIIDPDGRVMEVNEAAEEAFGFSSDELSGREIDLLVPAEKQAEERKNLLKCRQGETITGIETVRQHKSGERIAVLLDYSLILGREKSPSAIVLLAKMQAGRNTN